MSPSVSSRPNLEKFAWLAIAAALATIALKTGAWWITDSVGLLADAAESVVNLIAAIAALVALRVAARVADDDHHFGHTKAEYFSAAIEGAMIFVAAGFIMWQALGRFLDPRPLESVGAGLGISVVASIINGGVAFVLIRAGRQYRSITLRADGFSMIFALVASSLWLIAVFYSMGYMRAHNEPCQTRFNACFALTIFGAIGVALSDNLLTLYLFYEIVSVCTYPLVAHHQDKESYEGARKYIVYLTATAKFFLLPALVLIYVLAGTLDFPHNISTGIIPF